MKLAGHTMATPEFSVEKALKYFAKLQLDGAEVIIQSGYTSGISLEASDETVKDIRKLSDDIALPIAATTPYLNLYNSLDETVRQREQDALMRVIDMSHILGAKSIRVYGGAFKDDETDLDGSKLKQLVKTLRACGDYAATLGIKLSIENHFGTMTTTVAETMRVIDAINHPAVGILYDQANLAFLPAEEYREAIDAQIEHINYVHVKDLVYRGGSPQKFRSDSVSHISEDIRTVYSRIPGDGILDWPEILQYLKNKGYDGWLSLEYERRWGKQDLPIATIGMPICVKRMRKWISELN